MDNEKAGALDPERLADDPVWWIIHAVQWEAELEESSWGGGEWST